jgi:methylenetetrahydrofolate dehydrogenase (NADP+)/methenyltetrahydrofolate cyclohydrolase
MPARILDGRAIAGRWTDRARDQAARLVTRTGVKPHLAVILVGDHPASRAYVGNKRKQCAAAGIGSTLVELAATASPRELQSVIESLNRDSAVHGILLQLPLPSEFDERRFVEAIDPRKDVDGLHPENLGLLTAGTPRFAPCTPLGVQRMLVEEGIATAGRHAVIVGRSLLVGRPLAMLLGGKGEGGDATVTVAHSRSDDLARLCRQADILIAAVGKPGVIDGSMVKPGATVIDVGINRTAEGKLTGDVDFESAASVAGAITPVPGGVGQLTVATLLANTIDAAVRQMTGGSGGVGSGSHG